MSAIEVDLSVDIAAELTDASRMSLLAVALTLPFIINAVIAYGLNLKFASVYLQR